MICYCKLILKNCPDGIFITDGSFIKEYLLQAIDIICPKQKQALEL